MDRNLDRGGSGLLSARDFRRVLAARLERELSDEELERVWHGLPLSADGLFMYRQYFSQLETGYSDVTLRVFSCTFIFN